MYAVVGCSECSMLWIVGGRPETSQCPRCGTRRAHAKRRKFLTTDDEDHAREVRASMLAARQDHGDTFAELDSFAEMDEYVDDAGVSDETYLQGSGVDPEAVATAGEDATDAGGGAGAGGGGSDPGNAGRAGSSRQAVVREALRNADEPTEADVVAYAGERGVSAEDARRVLEKLRRSGAVSETRGVYRLL